MANNVVELSEDYVPGAKFIQTNIEKHSVRELKKWLECRGLKKTEKKMDLVEWYWKI